jgi:hypothetical protein
MRGCVLGLGLAVATRAFSATEDSDKDRAAAEKIVRVELIPHYFTKDGFKVAPQQIDYEHYASLEPLLARSPTLWKSVQVTLATEYEKRQAAVNDAVNPKRRTWRPILRKAFQDACELRGGGSETSTLFAYSGAETEWLIAQVRDAPEPYVTDDEVALGLKKYFDGLTDHNIESYRKVSAQLSKLDQLMTPPQAAFIRREFLKYFE